MISDFSQIRTIMMKENGIAELMMNPVYDVEAGGKASQAEFVADMLNIMRLDAYRMGQVHGVDIEVQRMTPERAAVLLQDLVRGNNIKLVQKFQEIEDLYDKIFEEVLDEDEYEAHRELKQDQLFSGRDRESTDEIGDTEPEEMDTDPEQVVEDAN